MLPTSLTRCFEWSVHFNIKASYSGIGVGSVGTAACQVSWARGFQGWQRAWRKKKYSVRRNNGFGIEVDWNPTFPPDLLLESASLWLSTPWGATGTLSLASPVECGQRFQAMNSQHEQPQFSPLEGCCCGPALFPLRGDHSWSRKWKFSLEVWVRTPRKWRFI